LSHCLSSFLQGSFAAKKASGESPARYGRLSASCGTRPNMQKTETTDYDENSNLQHLKRYAAPISSSTAHLLDDLSYTYNSTKKNKLEKIGDAASNTAGYSAELDLPNQTNSANYVYNSIGELVENKQEDRGYEYNATGLVSRVYQLSTGSTLAEYTYNDKGLRYSKTSYSGGLFNVETEQLFYVYDAGGALVATYKKLVQLPGTVYALQAHTLYAAGRMGLLDAATGEALYELNDHVGNVRAVVKAGSSGVAETVSYTDYYPHGGIMPGRTYQSSLNFPYAYQGQEKDAATGLTNFELRQYDPRIGRWYNPDPYGQHHSPYLAMSNNPVSFTDPDGGWDGDNGFNDGFQQAMENSLNWMAMTPSERRAYQAANGTDYEGQFRDKVFDLAFLGGYEDHDGNLWYYSARKNDIGAWMKMYNNDPFGYYKTASDNGTFKAGASWLDVSERFVGLGYNGEVERMKWAKKTYGGNGDGSILDEVHQRLSMFNTQYNPFAHLANGIDGIIFGTDRFGNEQSAMQTTTQLASGIVFIYGGAIADGIVGATVGEAQISAQSSVNYINSSRVLLRSAEESGAYHNLPASIQQTVIKQGNVKLIQNYFKIARANLTNNSVQYTLPGTLNGTNGIYQIFTRPSVSGNTELIMHSFFKPIR